jgi:hypothetical protein
MVIFGVKVYESPFVNRFVKDTNKRLSSKNMVSNPFRGGIKVIKQEKEVLNDLFLIVKMEPLWPNISPFVGFFLALGGIMFGAPNGFFIVPITFFAIGFFWTSTFFLLGLKAGLRKLGYKGPIKMVQNKDLLEKLVERL